jgi:hypothetical protein
MTIETIRSWRLAQPFRPFTVILVDGRGLPVEFPYGLAISPTGTEIAYGSRTDGPLFIPLRDVKDIQAGLSRDATGVPV